MVGGGGGTDYLIAIEQYIVNTKTCQCEYWYNKKYIISTDAHFDKYLRPSLTDIPIVLI